MTQQFHCRLCNLFLGEVASEEKIAPLVVTCPLCVEAREAMKFLLGATEREGDYNWSFEVGVRAYNNHKLIADMKVRGVANGF